MIRLICKFIFKITGWKIDNNLPPEIDRCIIIAAPHTSNWDYWYTMASFRILRIKIRVTIKREWMRFPFNIVTASLGGIAVDRRPKDAQSERPSLVDVMIKLFKDHEKLTLVITPEASRSLKEKWKTGFYRVAEGAKVPICFGYVDYKKKIAGIAKTLYISDFEADMREIMAFYQLITAKYPEKFSVDLNYV